MKIAFIGIGNVGFAIANNLQNKNFECVIAHNDENSSSVKAALIKNPKLKLMSIQEAINYCDVVISSIPFSANETVLKGLKFDGKTLIDCTNPIGAGLVHGLNSQRSGAEFVQELAPDANVVKAFNTYGYENFADASFPEYNAKPAMPIAGNNEKAKLETKQIVEAIGYEAVDTGNLQMSLHLEHLTLLWVKMVRLGGHTPHFVWSRLVK